MFRRPARYAAVFLVTLALLAPLASGWAMAIGLTEGRILVICTGDGLRWIQIDADGDPIELGESAEHCVLVHAVYTAAPTVPTPIAPELVYVAQPAFARTGELPETYELPSLPRAPPAL